MVGGKLLTQRLAQPNTCPFRQHAARYQHRSLPKTTYLRRRAVTTVSLLGVVQAAQIVQKANSVWDKYDTSKDGELQIDEVVALLNSDDLCDFVEKVTSVRPLQRSREDIEHIFKDADADNSLGLSRPEFLAMYLRIVGDRVKANPKVLMQALLGTIDADKDGVIDGAELKRLVKLVGVPGFATFVIPEGVKLDYKGASKILGLQAGEA